MIRSSEIEIHVRAKELYERENPGCFWRMPANTSALPRTLYRTAGLIERQAYLGRVREQMRAEGVFLEVDECPPQPGARR